MTIIRGPGEALLGLVFGCVMGLLCWYLPHRKNVSFYKIIKYDICHTMLLNDDAQVAGYCIFNISLPLE